MARDYKTPGVYVEEISTLPPSVAQVATAVPAFLGNTEKQPEDKQPRRITSLLEYRESFGGPSPKKYKLTATGDAKTGYSFTSSTDTPDKAEKYIMYYALKLYFSNGGGPCYVHSVGTYDSPADKAAYGNLSEGGIATINKIDEPTILVTPDTALSLTAANHYMVCGALIDACAGKQDRFAVVDVPKTTKGYEITAFRSGVASNHLDYGAAYMPYLKSGIAFEYDAGDVTINSSGTTTASSPEKVPEITLDDALKITYTGTLAANEKAKVKVVVTSSGPGSDATATFASSDKQLTITVGSENDYNKASAIKTAWDSAQETGWTLAVVAGKGDTVVSDTTDFKDLTTPQGGGGNGETAWEKTLDGALKITYTGTVPSGEVPKVKAVVKSSGTGSSTAATFASSNKQLTITVGSKNNRNQASAIKTAWDSAQETDWTLAVVAGEDDTLVSNTADFQELTKLPNGGGNGATLASFKVTNTTLYNQAIAFINALPRVTLPPSAAVAGLYCQVDNDRGVWKAPANVSLANVIGPDQFISDKEQEDLNVDPTSGKSINAIRSFTGRGTLVWGARTLDGNSNEWRYIPVRRLFITIEESVQKASAFAVFEPNDVSTWLKVKAMIESYLYGLWQQGAMMGASPDQAYFVHVGLGKTMTQQDVLEGRMIVHVGIAAVRPAEFIVLRFQHYMQES